MIRYSLKCSDGHSFDSWFNSAQAFDRLQGGGLLSCAVCGSADVSKAIMAPRIAAGETSRRDAHPVAPQSSGPRNSAQQTPAPHPAATATSASPDRASLRSDAAATPMEKAVAELRRTLEKHSQDVGRDFLREARRIHEGEAPARMIHGEARIEDARSLIEDGIEITPLPFLPRRKLS